MNLPVEEPAEAQEPPAEGQTRLDQDPLRIPISVDEIDDSIFDDIYNNHRKGNTIDDEGDEELEEEGDEAQDGSEAAGQNPPASEAALQARIAQLETMVSNLLSNNRPAPAAQTETPQTEPLRERIAKVIPGSTPQQVDQLVAAVRAIGDEVYAPALQQITQRIEQITGAVGHQEVTNQRELFERQLAQGLDSAQVTDPEERSMIRDAVIGRGWARFGDRFSIEHVPIILKELVGAQRKLSHSREERMIDQRETDMRNTPPVLSGRSGAPSVTVSTIRQGVRRPSSDKDWDMTGRYFEDTLGKFFDVAGRPRRRR